MTSSELRTLVLGIALAILVVPFGGAQTAPALLLIAGLVVFDIYRQRRRAGK